MFTIENKVVLITGALGGIGSELVESFMNVNAKVIAIDQLKELEDRINSLVVNDFTIPIPIIADITNNLELDSTIKKILKKYGRIDVLVNCAGVNIRKKIDEYTNEEWDIIQNINVKSIFNLSNKVAKVMKNQKKGRIINISSIQGVTCWNGKGQFSLAPYCVSKASVIALTKAFALDLAKYNITVNAVCPAFVDTPLVYLLKDNEELYQDIINRTPLGRFADPKEIASPVLFLASDESSFITGHSLMVDGGWTIE